MSIHTGRITENIETEDSNDFIKELGSNFTVNYNKLIFIESRYALFNIGKHIDGDVIQCHI